MTASEEYFSKYHPEFNTEDLSQLPPVSNTHSYSIKNGKWHATKLRKKAFNATLQKGLYLSPNHSDSIPEEIRNRFISTTKLLGWDKDVEEEPEEEIIPEVPKIQESEIPQNTNNVLVQEKIEEPKKRTTKMFLEKASIMSKEDRLAKIKKYEKNLAILKILEDEED